MHQRMSSLETDHVNGRVVSDGESQQTLTCVSTARPTCPFGLVRFACQWASLWLDYAGLIERQREGGSGGARRATEMLHKMLQERATKL
jgi:hypothetical protein